MRRLHHFILCPFSRKIRVLLAEKKLEFDLKEEQLTKNAKIKFDIGPASQLPALVDVLPHSENEETIITGVTPITEYLEDVYTNFLLLGNAPLERSEVRRLMAWFDYQVYHDVIQPFLAEKILKRLFREGSPNSVVIRLAQQHLLKHFDQLAWLLSQRSCLASEKLTAADFTAAAHISVLDYLGAIPWHKFPSVQTWYARIKSRPTFRSILEDKFAGLSPPKYYMALDF